MKKLLVIDGSNLMKGFYDQGANFVQKRDRIIHDIKKSHYFYTHDIIIVFDSKQHSFTDSEILAGIKVLYSGYHKDADAVIAELVSQKTAYAQKIVVSSDRLVQEVIFGFEKTYRKSSREFHQEIKD